MSDLEYCVCPLCGLNRPVHAEGGDISFAAIDPESSPFIQTRRALGRTPEGRSQGFPLVSSITLPQAAGEARYAPMLSEMAAQVKRVAAVLKRLGVR